MVQHKIEGPTDENWVWPANKTSSSIYTCSKEIKVKATYRHSGVKRRGRHLSKEGGGGGEILVNTYGTIYALKANHKGP